MGQRILLVEPRSTVVERLKTVLSGYETTVTKTGQAALKVVRETQPDLVLCNIDLPSMSGFDLMGRLRANKATRDIPVLLLETGATAMPGMVNSTDDVFRLEDFPILARKIQTFLCEQKREILARDLFRAALAGLEKGDTQEFTAAETAVLAEGGFPVRASLHLKPIAERAAEYAALLATGLSTAQAATRFGVNPSRIRQRLVSRPPTLYGIRHGTDWILPAFQFQEQDLVPNIASVIARLDPELDLVAVAHWFTQPNPDLVQTHQTLSPLDWLRQGLPPAPVVSLAENL